MTSPLGEARRFKVEALTKRDSGALCVAAPDATSCADVIGRPVSRGGVARWPPPEHCTTSQPKNRRMMTAPTEDPWFDFRLAIFIP